MRAAAIQMDPAWEAPEQNMARAERLIAEAVDRGAGLVVLPEMFATGFSMNTGVTAEPRGGRVHAFLSGQARSHGIHLLGTNTERSEELAHNVALLFAPDGSELLRYAKLHPFSFAGEHERFAPGLELPVARVEDFHLAATICYDLRFPELFRALCFRGADLFVVPANWPVARVAHWSQLLVARAIENQAFVVGVNRVGSGGGLDYNGCSAIIDPMGTVLAEGRNTEQVIVADLEPERLEETRKELPFLADARRDVFSDLWP